MPAFNFTYKSVAALENTTDKRQYYSDSGCPGLQLMVSPAGAKSFRLHTRDKRRGKTVQIVLGRFPTLPIASAREIVREKLAHIAAGRDVKREAEDERNELTLDEVFDSWLENYSKPNKKSWKDDRNRYNSYIRKPLGHKKVSAITPEAIERLRTSLTTRKKERGKDAGTLSKTTVNRTMSIISTIYNQVLPNLNNPCSQVSKYKESRRTVFLKTDDLKRFFTEIESSTTPDYVRDYLLLSLYTGARRANVLAMQWNDIDLEMGLWIVRGEQMKNGEQLVISLSEKEKDILRSRKKNASSVFVFPGKGKTGHFMEPKRGWKSFLKRAGLPEDMRLHDLRRTHGSWLAHTNASSDIIGMALGHKSKAATEHYVHLTMGPVAEAKQKALDAMEGVREVEDKVVNLPKKS